MLLRNVFTRSIWDARRSLPGWIVAVTAVGALYAAFWPTIRSPEMARAMAAYPQDVLSAFNYTDLTTPAGYLSGAVYGLLVPLLVAIFMIAGGARALAGDENAGTLDLVLAHPVGRVSLALQRFAGQLAGMAAVAVVLCAAMLALRAPFQLTGISAAGVVAINLHLALFGAAMGALAFAVGAVTGSRGAALAVSAGVGVLAYLGNSVSPWDWTRTVSPFHWYLGGMPLVHGVQWAGVAALAATAVVLTAVGAAAFTRRDLNT